MIGSYGPNTPDKPVYIKDLEAEEAPSGMLARGEYTVLSRVIDDDKYEYASSSSFTFLDELLLTVVDRVCMGLCSGQGLVVMSVSM